MTTSVEGPEQRLCSRYVNLFLERTEHAAPPDGSQAGLGKFAVDEASRVELANRDKAMARKVLSICETEGAEAKARAVRAMKPWYKRVFS